MVEATYAVLSVDVIVVFDKTETKDVFREAARGIEEDLFYPLHWFVDISIIALQLTTGPKRAPYAASISSDVFG